jgi:hypothetical protein
VLAELGALDLAALERRLAALPADLLRARAVRRARLRGRARAPRSSACAPSYAGGAWRRKSVVDPRSKKPREVRDVRVDGLVLDCDGTLEEVALVRRGHDPRLVARALRRPARARVGRPRRRLDREPPPSRRRGARAGTLASQIRRSGAPASFTSRARRAGRAAFAPGASGSSQSGDDAAKAELEEPTAQPRRSRRRAARRAGALVGAPRPPRRALAARRRRLDPRRGPVRGTGWELPPDPAAPRDGDPCRATARKAPRQDRRDDGTDGSDRSPASWSVRRTEPVTLEVPRAGPARARGTDGTWNGLLKLRVTAPPSDGRSGTRRHRARRALFGLAPFLRDAVRGHSSRIQAPSGSARRRRGARSYPPPPPGRLL